MIEAVLPLDQGKMYFPLGTSVGWENPIHDTRVVFSLPDDRSLESSQSGSSAYVDGEHHYLFSYPNANPDFDIDGEVRDSDGAARDIKFLVHGLRHRLGHGLLDVRFELF